VKPGVGIGIPDDGGVAAGKLKSRPDLAA